MTDTFLIREFLESDRIASVCCTYIWYICTWLWVLVTICTNAEFRGGLSTLYSWESLATSNLQHSVSAPYSAQVVGVHHHVYLIMCDLGFELRSFCYKHYYLHRYFHSPQRACFSNVSSTLRLFLENFYTCQYFLNILCYQNFSILHIKI